MPNLFNLVGLYRYIVAKRYIKNAILNARSEGSAYVDISYTPSFQYIKTTLDDGRIGEQFGALFCQQLYNAAKNTALPKGSRFKFGEGESRSKCGTMRGKVFVIRIAFSPSAAKLPW
ncbi:MAG: hypothetical protein GJ680_07525 [Alteromonadaceae bacterium]|nr:hypothetical protein [Alteromonadaceae bacterium]